MNEVTLILSAIEQGDPHAAEQLLPLVYDELCSLASQKLAQEKPGQTLEATALVHEAYLRLVDTPEAQQWNSRGHFFAAAAEAMRRILLDRARDKGRLKRGGSDWRRLSLDQIDLSVRIAKRCGESTRWVIVRVPVRDLLEPNTGTAGRTSCCILKLADPREEGAWPRSARNCQTPLPKFPGMATGGISNFQSSLPDRS